MGAMDQLIVASDRGLYADRLPAARKRFTAEHLLWSSFQREAPVWRQRYDHHVQQWRRAVHEETCDRLHSDARFAAAYTAAQSKAAEVLADWSAGLGWGGRTDALRRAAEQGML